MNGYERKDLIGGDPKCKYQNANDQLRLMHPTNQYHETSPFTARRNTFAILIRFDGSQVRRKVDLKF